MQVAINSKFIIAHEFFVVNKGCNLKLTFCKPSKIFACELVSIVNSVKMDSTRKSDSEINLDSFLKLPLRLCRVAFLNFEPRKSNQPAIERVKNFLKSSFLYFCLFAMFVAFCMMMAYTFLLAPSFDKVSSTIANISSLVLIASKAITTSVNRTKIWEMFQELEKLFDGRTDKNSAYNVKAYLKSYHRFIKIYSGSFIIVSPVMVLPLVLYYINGTMTFKVDYWYPFDPYQPSTFLCASLWTIWIAFTILIFLLGTESLLYVLISVLVMEFDFLKGDFMKLKDLPKNEMSKAVGKLVDRHNKLLDLSDKLQEIYQYSFLTSFVITSMIMCFVAFQLSIAKDFDAYSLYIPFITIIGGQIFLLCLFAQNLIDSSHAIADGVYELGWENIDDVRIKRDLILVIMRGNRAKNLSAMKFSELSLATFNAVRIFRFFSVDI